MADAVLDLKVRNWDKFRLEISGGIGRFNEQSELFDNLVKMALRQPKEAEVKEYTDQLESFSIALSTKNPSLASAIGQFCSLSKVLYVNPEFPSALKRLKLASELFRANEPSPQEKNQELIKIKVQEWNVNAKTIYDAFDTYTKLRRPLYTVLSHIKEGKAHPDNKVKSALSELLTLANQLSSKDPSLANALNKFSTISSQYLGKPDAAVFMRFAALMPIMRSLGDMKRIVDESDQKPTPKPEPHNAHPADKVIFDKISWRNFLTGSDSVDFTFDIEVKESMPLANIEITLVSPNNTNQKREFRVPLYLSQTQLVINDVHYNSHNAAGNWRVLVRLDGEVVGDYTIEMAEGRPNYVTFPNVSYRTESIGDALYFDLELEAEASRKLENSKLQIGFRNPGGLMCYSQTYTFSYPKGRSKLSLSHIKVDTYGAGTWKLQCIVDGQIASEFDMPLEHRRPTSTSSSSTSSSSSDDTKSTALGCGLLIVAALICWMFFKSCGSSSSSKENDSDHTEYIVMADNLSMRNGSSKSSAKVQELNFGDIFRFHSAAGNGYAYGEAKGRKGYVSSDYLIESQDYTRLRKALPTDSYIGKFAETAKHRFAINAALKEVERNHPDCDLSILAPGKIVKNNGKEYYAVSIHACNSTYTYVYSMTSSVNNPLKVYFDEKKGNSELVSATKNSKGWKLKYKDGRQSDATDKNNDPATKSDTQKAVTTSEKSDKKTKTEPEVQTIIDGNAKELEDEVVKEKEQKETDIIYTTANVQQQPSFPGGETAMHNWISQNIKYPSSAAEEGASGRVTVSFVVTKNGAIENVKVTRGCHPALDMEAVRVVRSMPAWNPGRNNGSPVSVQYVLPVTFKRP